MSDRGDRLFRALPGPLRSVAAGVHGVRLRRWRYGADTDRLVREAIAREHWSSDRWQSWLAGRHGELLDRAALVPHYRGHLADDIAAFPLLDKSTLRSAPATLLASDVDPSSMYEEHTSGSTGTPLQLWWSRATTRAWYALFEARGRGWHGAGRNDHWAIFGGRLVVDAARRRPPFWVWNAGMRQLYLSSFHLSPSTAEAYAAAIEQRGIRHLVGYPSAIATLAHHLAEKGRSVAGVRVAIANAEPVSDRQRALVQQVFDAPLVETYGMAELAAAASECEAGERHLWPEVGAIEVIDGELVATGLLNLDMPLIRYRTGDRLAAPPEWDHDCPCGRTLPRIGAIDGRVDDVVITPDGRRLGRLDPVFKTDLPLVEAQVIQDRDDHLRVLIVPAPGFADDDRGRLARRVTEHVGAMEVDIEVVDDIGRGPGGKFRGVINEMELSDP